MRTAFEPKLGILPQAQQELWPRLKPASALGMVLYGGTAIALHLGHRVSIDFDFFGADALDKNRIENLFEFMKNAKTIQDDVNTLVVMVDMPAGPVKVSFFGGIGFGRVNPPLQSAETPLLVASLDDLMATKLKTILDRAEAKDYRDIAAMISAGVSLARGLGAFSKMFGKDPALPLRALGYFKDGDLPTLPKADRHLLAEARDHIADIPAINLTAGSLSI